MKSAIRAVNAVLTQLDQLKSRRNVLVLTTSNITGAIDVAFVDRADIKQFIGPPSVAARYSILKSCIQELQRRQILADESPLAEVHKAKAGDHPNNATRMLMECARRCEGMSGRSLRKIPAVTHSMFGHIETTEEFINNLAKAIEAEAENRSMLFDAK